MPPESLRQYGGRQALKLKLSVWAFGFSGLLGFVLETVIVNPVVLREQFLSEGFFGFAPGSVKGRAFTAQRSCNGLLLREHRWERWCRIRKMRLEFARTHVL